MAPDTPADAPKVQKESLIEAQTRLLRMPASSDLVVKCGERTWRCQSVILAQRCEFFRAACEGEFKESLTRTITLDDDDESAVDMLLLYLYTLEDPVFQPISGNARRVLEAYVIGDKYEVLGLKSAAHSYILQRLNREGFPEWDEMTPPGKGQLVWMVGELWHGEFPAADDIKSAFLEKVVGISKQIIEEDAFQALLRENPKFNLEFVRALAQKAGKD